jgi:hypothetical protein
MVEKIKLDGRDAYPLLAIILEKYNSEISYSKLQEIYKKMLEDDLFYDRSDPLLTTLDGLKTHNLIRVRSDRIKLTELGKKEAQRFDKKQETFKLMWKYF